MAERVKAVVIGGGIVGVSVLYHLARRGWRDVILLERSELTAGSTWHAAAGFHAINGDANVARLQAYTIDLYKEVEDLGGHSCGLHMTGGLTVAASPQRWEWLQAEWARQQVIGLHSRLVDAAEIAELCPIMDTTDVRGGIADPNEGHLDPNGATHAFAKAARALGAEVRLHTFVSALSTNVDGTWTVVTDNGDIQADHVVNAAGLWAPRVAAMAGVELPAVPLEHMYIVTEPMAAVGGLTRELPMTADLDAHIYLRQEQRSVLLGVYEDNPRHWHPDGVPWDFGMELIPEDLDRIIEPLSKGFARFPVLQSAGIRRVVNGGMVFTPDGNPLVGPVRGRRNFWCACASMAGFSQHGAIARSLAEWMIDGAPSSDVFGMDVARFGDYATRDYVLAKTRENYARRIKLPYPNEQLPAARPWRTGALYELQKNRNAVFGAVHGLEYPLYFAGPGDDATETPTFHRSNAFAAVAEECIATRAAAGLLDITAYAKYAVHGPDATRYLQNLLAGRMPDVGRLRLSPMLNEQGRVIGDLTVFRLDEDEFMIVGSPALQNIHMRWFEEHIGAHRVSVTNCSSVLAGVAVAGPSARQIVSDLVEDDVGPHAWPMFAVKRVMAASVPAIMARLSMTGELGYELYVEPAHQIALHAALTDGGARHGLRQIGLYALNSLRLEKAHGIWFREFSADYTPAMCGLDRFTDYAREGFIGRQAALADRAAPPSRKLVGFSIDTDTADAVGFEPVWLGGDLIGYTTSGGYGHTVGKSLALGYVDVRHALEGLAVDIAIVGRRRSATMTLRPWFDPDGGRARA